MGGHRTYKILQKTFKTLTNPKKIREIDFTKKRKIS